MIQSSSSATILVAKFHLRGGAQDEFAAWQGRALTRAASAKGFVSSEITPAGGEGEAWAVNLRFRDRPSLDSWGKSPVWRSLLDEARAMVLDKTSIETEVREVGSEGGVVEVIVTKVKPGQEIQYREWETRVQQAQSKFPGYLGSYVQPPIAGELGWTTLMRFASAGQLEQWLGSKERSDLLAEVQPLIDYAHLQRVDTSFPGWFPSDPNTGKGPPNWKAAMLVLLGLFPIVMLEARFLSPHLAGLNSSLAMFIGNVISVALTTWLTMPLFIKAFAWWLFPKVRPPAFRTELLGSAVIVALFAIEVAALWHLLR